jgi:hypothetical protein
MFSYGKNNQNYSFKSIPNVKDTKFGTNRNLLRNSCYVVRKDITAL